MLKHELFLDYKGRGYNLIFFTKLKFNKFKIWNLFINKNSIFFIIKKFISISWTMKIV